MVSIDEFTLRLSRFNLESSCIDRASVLLGGGRLIASSTDLFIVRSLSCLTSISVETLLVALILTITSFLTRVFKSVQEIIDLGYLDFTSVVLVKYFEY